MFIHQLSYLALMQSFTVKKEICQLIVAYMENYNIFSGTEYRGLTPGIIIVLGLLHMAQPCVQGLYCSLYRFFECTDIFSPTAIILKENVSIHTVCHPMVYAKTFPPWIHTESAKTVL